MSKRKKMLKIIILIGLAVLCLLLTWYVIIPFIRELSTDEGRLYIQQKVESFGVFAPLLFIVLEIVQIILALIPGGPVEMTGGVLFGAIWGLILCEIGIFCATAIIYNLVKKFGRPLVDAFVSEEKFKKFRFLHDEKKLELIVFIILMIPGTPKDVITYMTSLTDIRPMRFFLLATIARIPAVTSLTLMGSTLSKGKPIMTVIIFLITGAIGITGIFLNNYITSKRSGSSEKNSENDCK